MASKQLDDQAGTRQILFIQGGGEGTHAEWDSKLVANLRHELGSGHDVLYPCMPNEENPEFGTWRDAITREIFELNEGAVLVGHSIGATILVHTLARQPRLVKGISAVCLIAAPFVGDGGWTSGDLIPASDWAAALCETDIYLYRGEADETVPITHLDLYAKAIPHARVRSLAGRDHQLDANLREVANDIRSAETS